MYFLAHTRLVVCKTWFYLFLQAQPSLVDGFPKLDGLPLSEQEELLLDRQKDLQSLESSQEETNSNPELKLQVQLLEQLLQLVRLQQKLPLSR